MGKTCCACTEHKEQEDTPQNQQEPLFTSKKDGEAKGFGEPEKEDNEEGLDNSIIVFKSNHSVDDGNVYTGSMKKVNGQFLKHGKGKQQWVNGGVYDGYWHEDKMQGQGTFLHANKDLYVGEFDNDKANGFGKYE